MRNVLLFGCVLLLVVPPVFAAPAAVDRFAGKFTTAENGEYAVLTLVPEGSGYSGAILLDGYATSITAERRAKDLRGEMTERDGAVYPFEARVNGAYLIMEFDDGAMIVFRRDEEDVE